MVACSSLNAIARSHARLVELLHFNSPGSSLRPETTWMTYAHRCNSVAHEANEFVQTATPLSGGPATCEKQP